MLAPHGPPHPLPTSSPELATADLSSVSVKVSSQESTVCGARWHVDFRAWHFPHSTGDRSTFRLCLWLTPFPCQLCSVLWMDHCWTDCSPAGGHVSGFQFGVIANSVAVNIPAVSCADMSLRCSGLNVREYTVAGLCGSCVFSLLRNREAAFQSVWIIFHSQPQSLRDPVSLHPRQRVVVSLLL